MTITTLQPPVGDAEYGLEDLSRVSNEFFSAVSGQAEGSSRGPGLLITNEDVRHIRRYVNNGLALPTDLEQIRQLLGNYDSGIDGLQAADIQVLYQGIRGHVQSWAMLENDMRAVGSDLHVFSGNLISTLEVMVTFIQSLDSWQRLELDSLTEEQLAQMPPTPLLDSDRQNMPGLLALVAEIRRHVEVHSGSTLRVKEGATVFKGRLRDEIAPQVSLKIRLADSVQASDEMAALRDRIRVLNERIEQKISQYEEYCKYRWIGFWWGPVGGAISWSIYGPKAAAVLRDKDQLLEEKNALETRLRQLDKFVADLQNFETSLQDLKIRIEGAISGVSNMESLWTLLKDLVDSSSRQLANIEDVRLLVIFSSRFKNVMQSWRDIQVRALELLTAFNNVLDERRR